MMCLCFQALHQRLTYGYHLRVHVFEILDTACCKIAVF